jgi:hypothetical protein
VKHGVTRLCPEAFGGTAARAITPLIVKQVSGQIK